MMRILVMGLGNIILRDEGLGLVALRRLTERYTFSDDVEILDAGILGMSLLAFLDNVSDLLIVDAVRAGQESGELIRLEGSAIDHAAALHAVPRHVRLQELIALGGLPGSAPKRIVLWGMEPASVEPGLELTTTCAARIDELVDAVVRELRAWGVTVMPA